MRKWEGGSRSFDDGEDTDFVKSRSVGREVNAVRLLDAESTKDVRLEWPGVSADHSLASGSGLDSNLITFLNLESEEGCPCPSQPVKTSDMPVDVDG
jgi:hypothetical protein